jgi:hypothetical protein
MVSQSQYLDINFLLILYSSQQKRIRRIQGVSERGAKKKLEKRIQKWKLNNSWPSSNILG